MIPSDFFLLADVTAPYGWIPYDLDCGLQFQADGGKKKKKKIKLSYS